MCRAYFCKRARNSKATRMGCEGETFDGFPHSRSITRPQAGDEARLATGIPRMAKPFVEALPDLWI